MAFRLEIEDGEETIEKTFKVSEIAIGRADSADVLLDDQTVSRKHARIRSEDGEHTLIVLSKNGMTAVQGKQVHGEVAISDGAILHFGTIKCVFHAVLPTELREVEDATPALEDEPTELRKVEDATPALEDEPTELRKAEDQPPALEDAPTEMREIDEPDEEKPKFEDDPTQFRPVEEAPVAPEPAPEPELAPEPEPQLEPEATADESAATADEFPDEESQLLVSWDQIANSDEATRQPGDDEKVESNYEKIRAAAEIARKQSTSSSLRLAVGGLLIVGLLAFTFYYEAGGPLQFEKQEETAVEIPPLTFMPGEIDCANEAECLARAQRNYKIGIERLDNADAQITNRFDGWKQLVMVERYAEKAKLGTLPDEFSELEERKTRVRAELDETYRKALQSYHHHSQYKMYTEMVEVLNSVKAHFPHEGAREFKWAQAQERLLKEQGNYPMRMRRKQQGRL